MNAPLRERKARFGAWNRRGDVLWARSARC